VEGRLSFRIHRFTFHGLLEGPLPVCGLPRPPPRRVPRTPFRDNDPIGGPRKDYFLSGRRSSQLAGRLIKHARYYWLMLAKSHLTRRLFGSMIRRIDALAAATG